MKIIKPIKNMIIGTVLISMIIPMSLTVMRAKESEMHASEEIVSLIKEMEGFSEKPYWDYAQWTAGYGTKVPLNELTNTMLYGIDEKRADELMRDHLLELEPYVKEFEKVNHMKLNQNQFDAMLSFTYNCGPGWMKNSTPQRMIVDKANEEDIMYGFGLWSTAGGNTLPGLVRRRLCEANLFSNGVYSTRVPDNYYYVSFRPTVGKTPVLTQSFMTDGAKIKANGTSEQYSFEGWFTDPITGEKVTSLTKNMNKQIVFAHWNGYNPLEVEIPDNIKTMQLNPEKEVIVSADGINMRILPGLTTNKTDLAMKGDKLKIDIIADVDGIIWGRSVRGWIALAYTDYDGNLKSSTKIEENKNKDKYSPVNALICCEDYVDVRSTAGAGGKIVTKLPNDMPITIYEEKTADGLLWGRTICGWVSLNYVDFTKEVPDWYKKKNPDASNEVNEKLKKWGTVQVTHWLNVRKTPSNTSEIVGKYYNGEKQFINEVKIVDGVNWGKTDLGWICLNYVKIAN